MGDITRVNVENLIPSKYNQSLLSRALRFITNWLNNAAYGHLFNVTTVTATYTVSDTDSIIICDATSGTFTITFPAAAAAKNKVFFLKKTDASANAITLGTIDGSSKSLGSQYDSYIVGSDGTNYWIF